MNISEHAMIMTENKQHGDHTLAVCDFNVDFDHGCSLTSLLIDFIVEHNFCCD